MQRTSEQLIAEYLFFRLYESYLLHKPEIKENYELLLHHYNSYPNSFNTLTKEDLFRLKQIQEDVKNNRYTLLCGSFCNYEIDEIIAKEKTDKNHKEICKQLLFNCDELFKNIVGPINYSSYEHPTMYGPIDLVFQSNKTVYIIEVKTNTANHAIIGQVSKYYIALSLKIILKHYNDVKIITVCPGYDKPSLSGLKKIGATPLILSSNPMKLSVISIKE